MRVERRKGYRMLVGGAPQDRKQRQACKIKELADALVTAGFVSLDSQAMALGLSRSTTWTILKAKHKNYGLSAALVRRVLSKPDLNSHVRTKIVEYIREKAGGSYGHNNTQLRRFARHLAGATDAGVDVLALADVHPKRNTLRRRTAARK